MSDTMIAIEFQTQIKDGAIEVPMEYRDQLSGTVRVIILRTEHRKASNIIERMLRNPIRDPTFTPLRRDEIYNRQG
ncbi:hypothetical protein [Oscillochloris sp. ZM17-4]|uniref:hypothetical protein n=1 Tax=Oscillochloris sp. ZM17-4 TaxID=2866714 RepID=UPI00210629E1|nr:hypothetical protein [Oscillochloris sp. ZM17-4]